jgi:hypothetical protein
MNDCWLLSKEIIMKSLLAKKYKFLRVTDLAGIMYFTVSPRILSEILCLATDVRGLWKYTLLYASRCV